MIRLLRLLFLAALAIVLVVVALANRAPVELRLLPEEAGQFLGYSWTLQLPLFLVILGGVLIGLLIGFVWEWVRETGYRTEARRKSYEADRLNREVTTLREKKQGPKDDVLALIEQPRR